MARRDVVSTQKHKRGVTCCYVNIDQTLPPFINSLTRNILNNNLWLILIEKSCCTLP